MQLTSSIRNFFNVGKDVVNNLKEIAIYDENIKNHISQAGGLISLVGTALEIYHKYQNKKKSPEQKAFASLLNVVFQITVDLLKDVKDQEERKKTVANFETNWKTMQQELFIPFEENSDWNNHLPKHPAVRDYVSKIIAYLNQESYNSEKIRSFVDKFSIELEHRSNKDPDLIVFNDYRELQQEYKDLVGYLEHVETMKYYAFSLERKPLRDYYIPHEAVLTNVSETWSLGDEHIRKKYANNIKNIRQVIEEELLTHSGRPYLLVGASFGIGKSSMSRMIASEYASNYLDKNQGLKEHKTGNYIPIIVFLKYGLKVEYRGYNLDSLLKNIVAPENNKEASNREILLILDGLDEYENTNLIDKLEELGGKYRNLKTIITTRLEDDIFTTHKIKRDIYVRLLGFTAEQVDKFFGKYGVQLKGEQLTYQLAKKLNLPIEEMTKPLFAWIFSFLDIYEPELKIDAESKAHWTDRMIKSWIYLLFFHHIIEGKFKDPFDDSWKNSYITEKIILRRIAALKQIHRENLTWKASEKGFETSTAPYVQKELKKFESTANLDPTSVLSSSYFFYLRPTTTGKIVESVHRTFMEYLLAEYYIESLLEGKVYRLNAATPSKETILFLDGLIDLLIETKDAAVGKYIDKEETSLLKSFNYYKGREKAKEELITITSKAVNEESITLLNPYGPKEEKAETESNWISIMINVNDYKNLWIQRWISLYILNKLDQNYRLVNDKLLDMIILTSSFIPPYMKNFSKIHFGNCPGIDLSGANISYAEFSGAKLIGANFSSATISEIVTGGGDSPFADFSGANFSYAKLVSVKPWGTELGYVIFRGTNFSHADLSGARLYDSDLTGTKLDYAKLISADLTRADLSGAKLLGTNLTKANLSNTKFIGVDFLHYNFFDSAYFTRADLSGANLSNSDFSNSVMVGANLTRCDLSGAKFINTNLSYSLIIEIEKYDNLVCDGADFSNAIIDSKDLVAYLRNNNAKNVPDALTNIIEIRKKISEDTKKLENTVL